MMNHTICLRTTPSVRKNYNGIDLAKFICSILVIMIHIRPFGTSTEYTTKLLNYGVQNWLARIAVPIFFACSGFFLYRKTTLRSFSVEPSKQYIAHLLKLYIIWTLIYFPLRFRTFFNDPKGVLHAVGLYCRDCIFTGSYTQLWYFPALIFAVFLTTYPLSVRIRYKHVLAFSIIAYLIGLLAQSWFGIIRPLQKDSPFLWHLLKILQIFVVTTRDGLFDGFFFVNIGAFFAFYDVHITKMRALTGFFISMTMMFVEAFFLKYINFVKAHDMYLFLIPATFFGFAFISRVELPEHPIFLKLRKISSLIFYSHLWVKTLIRKGFQLIDASLLGTPLLFISTTLFTLIASSAVVRLSEKKRFQWLRLFYT